MSEKASGGETPNATPSAPKDRPCKFCGKPYTSSSLGRHYDQWIKAKNPKAPDGIHDIEEIRKLRGSITRRQPRNSMGGRRRASASVKSPTDTPGASTRSPEPANPPASASRPRFPGHDPFQHGWEQTGVMNLPPSTDGDGEPGNTPQQASGSNAGPSFGGTVGRRNFSKMDVMKAQYDMRQKLKDANDRSRATELALREVLLSLRAARLQTDMGQAPFDFDPLSLDFPALCTHCLEVPPTLFSSNPHPTSTSWSVQPPDKKQFDGLRAYFKEEFRKWKLACQVVTNSHYEDLSTYASMNPQPPNQDPKELVAKAEKAALDMEKKVNEHLQSAWGVWSSLAPQRQAEIWSLEMCRAFGREKHKAEAHKDTDNRLRQELAKKIEEVEQLTRLQQPREFKIQPPNTVPIDRDMVTNLIDMSDQGFKGIGLKVSDRNSDLNTLVQTCIDRWTAAVVQLRSGRQKPLEHPGHVLSPINTRPSQPFATTTSAASVAAAKSSAASNSTSATTTQSSAPPSTAATESSQQTAVPQQQQQQPQQQQPPQSQQHQIQKQSMQPSQNSPLAKNPLPPYRRLGTQARPLAPNNNSANYAPLPLTTQSSKSSVPNAEMDIDQPSDQDADGDEDMDDEDSFATMSTPIVSQPQHSTLEVSRTRPSQQGVSVQGQQHAHHHQQHHHQAQRMMSSDHRAGQYMPGNPRMANGTSTGGSNQGMNQGMNMSRQMLPHGNVMSSGNPMGMGMGDQEAMYMG